MAKKRRVETKPEGSKQEEPSEDELPLRFQDLSWPDWFRMVLSSRLYALACVAFDVFFGLELARALGNELSWVALPVVAFLSAVEVTVYLYLWGSEGKLMQQD